MAMYQELPVFRDVYRLTLRIHQLTQSFSREFKFTLGQDMKRDCLGLLRSIYRVNRSRDKAPLLDAFLDDFELWVWANRLVVDVDGLQVPFIGRDDLLTNKRATGRPKDLLDVGYLTGR